MQNRDEQLTLNAVRTRTLHQLVEGIATTEDEQELATRFTDFIESYGFTSVASVSLPLSEPVTEDCILINTRPKAWVNEYLENGFLLHDPILRNSLTFGHPFAWQDVLRECELPPDQIQVMSHSADHGMCEGFVVPIYEANGKLGLVSLAGPDVTLDPIARSRLTLAAVFLYNKLTELKWRPRLSAVLLTHREREIVQWIAIGKSDWQIGQILNISQKTVNYHVENAKRKFGVATRIQAIVAALRLGLLDDV